MSIYKGTSEISGVNIGLAPISYVYKGNKLIFPETSAITGNLPIVYESKVVHILKNYTVYGTNTGAGVACESGEPAGYKIPLANTGENPQTETYPLYIGSTKLGEEEYLDYESGKIYKRTMQLLNQNANDTNNGYMSGRYLRSNGGDSANSALSVSEYIAIEENTEYTVQIGAAYSLPSICFYDTNKAFISGVKYDGATILRVTSPANAAYARMSFRTATTNALNKGSEAIGINTRYIVATDPPAPLPAIMAYKGENTLSSTVAVGTVSISGFITESAGVHSASLTDVYRGTAWSDIFNLAITDSDATQNVLIIAGYNDDYGGKPRYYASFFQNDLNELEFYWDTASQKWMTMMTYSYRQVPMRYSNGWTISGAGTYQGRIQFRNEEYANLISAGIVYTNIKLIFPDVTIEPEPYPT